MHFRTVLCSILLGPAMAPAAEAQAAAPADEAAALDRIVVTARRREEPLWRVPLSIAVVEGEAAEGSGLHGFAPALPGLGFTESGLFPGHELVVRGINATAFPNEARPLTAYYFGDTPLTYAATPTSVAMYDPQVETIDLDRIELLRGPQGTYFGAHSMGGALRFIPNAPDPGRRYGWFGFGATLLDGGGDGFASRAMLNVPLRGGAGAIRTVAFAREAPGWIDDSSRARRDVNGQQHVGVRSAASWDAERWRFEAGATGQQRSGDAPWIDELDEPEHAQSRLVDESEVDAWGLGWIAAERVGDGWRLRLRSARFERALDADIDVSDAALFNGLPPPWTAQNRNDQHEWTHELRLHSDRPGERIDWLVGVFLQDRVLRVAQDFPGPAIVAAGLAPDLGGGSTASLRSRTSFEQEALYGDVAWRPAPLWELTLGARWFRTRDLTRSVTGGLAGEADNTIGSRETGSAPRFSLRRELAEGRSWYASAAKGFRPAGANDPSGFDDPDCVAEMERRGVAFQPRFASDSLWNYEVGVRAALPQRGLYFSGALFRIDWDDIQTEVMLECFGIAFATNGRRARSEGVDLEAVWYAGEAWELAASTSWVRARYIDDLPGLGRGRGIALPGVPRLAWRLAATRHFPRHGWRLRLEHARVGESSVDPFGEAALRIGGYALTHLALAGGQGDWRWEVSLRNLFDVRAVTGAHDGFLGRFEAVQAPRSLGVALTRHF